MTEKKNLLRISTDYGFSLMHAKKYGISSAMILNRIAWSINYHAVYREKYEAEYFIDGRWWMNDTYSSIEDHFEGLIKVRTIKDAILQFERDGLLISDKKGANRWDHKKWYSIDVAKYTALDNFTDGAKNVLSDVDGAKNVLSMGKILPLHDGAKNVPSSSLNSHTISRTISRVSPSAMYSLPSLIVDKKIKSPKYDEQDLAIGQAWLEFALGEMKWKTATAAWTAERFAIDLAKIRRLIGVTHEGLSNLLAFIKKDKFWQDRAFSPAGLLRKNAEGIMKIDNILIQATKNERKNEKFTAMMNSEDPF